MNITGKAGRNGPYQMPGALAVIDIELGIYMGRIHSHQFFSPDHPADLAIRIIDISEGASSGRAGHHAGWCVALNTLAGLELGPAAVTNIP
jgi:hypothetical protein